MFIEIRSSSNIYNILTGNTGNPFGVFFSVWIMNISNANIVLTICEDFISLHISTGCVRVLNKLTPLFMGCKVMPSTHAFCTFMPSVLNNSPVPRYLAASNTFLGLTINLKLIVMFVTKSPFKFYWNGL